MSNVLLDHDPSLGFLFEAAAEGLDLQKRINSFDSAAQVAMSETVADLQDRDGTIADGASMPEGLNNEALRALALVADTGSLKAELRAKEQEVDAQLAETSLSVRVLSGEGRKLIMKTYFSGGAVGSRRQELSLYKRTHRSGIFRAALLGQNALVMFPQWLSGQQMDLSNTMVPILRDNGEPNIAIETRQHSFRDRISHAYDRRANTDLNRLRELATLL